MHIFGKHAFGKIIAKDKTCIPFYWYGFGVRVIVCQVHHIPTKKVILSYGQIKKSKDTHWMIELPATQWNYNFM